MKVMGAQVGAARDAGSTAHTGAEGGIAIVGIGCRLPGGVTTPMELWDLLASGGDAITEVPPGRFDLEALYDPDPSRPGRLYARWGGFIDAIDSFDAEFFGISPREARRMDPQQRLLLEVVWEALEDGGQRPDRLGGSATGVFVGISGHDYADLQSRPEGRDLIDLYVNPGSAASIAANRISYVFDLRGPSLAVDTACSSALTAVHLACASLVRGESDLAVAGAVNALLTPEPSIGFCKGRMLSPRGRCRPFDAGADGYVRSEGAGAVVLKPLGLALADGDPIYAVILGTAINQDGHTPGISVPNPAAQQALIIEVLGQAGLDPSDVQYIEAHGTGTPVGDPREAEAIGAVMAGRGRGDPCLVGSAKGNVGHLEAAAGMVGLVKAALSVQRRRVPASLHFERPHPAIAFDDWRLRVPTALEPWPATPTGRAVAGVNAFGFGGANAHVLVSEPPPLRGGSPATETDTTQVLTLSARSPGALGALAQRWIGLLSAEEGPSLTELCATAAVRRSHHEHRLAAVAGSPAELAAHLRAFAAGERRAGLSMGRAAPGGCAKVAFVFPGMGSQWWGMGRELLASEPVFAAVLEECDQVLRPLANWSLLDEIAAPEGESRLAETHVAHAANFALQVALAALWRSWGIVPDAVVGHSSGEMAAACVAGGLSVADGTRLAYHRGRLQHRTAGSGGMLAAGISPNAAAEVLAGYEQRLSLAAVNGPASVTFSGDRDALAEVAAALGRRGAFHRPLAVDVPYHGPQMDALRHELLAAVVDLDWRPPLIPLASTVSGAWQDGQPLDAEYWWANMRRPVRFAAAVDQLVADGCDLFVELSPHPVLAPSLLQCLEGAGREGSVLASLRRGGGERAAMLGAVGALYVRGREVDWTGVFGPGRRCVPLPTYPWQRERHWLDPVPETASRPPDGSDSGHPLLGRRVRAARPTWEADLGDPPLAYLDGHRVQDRVTFPAAGYLEVTLAAARALRGEGPLTIQGVEFRRLLVLGEGRQQLLGCLAGGGDSSVEIHSAATSDPGVWTLRAVGRIAAHLRDSTDGGTSVDLAAVRRRCGTPVDVGRFYSGLADRHGLRYEGAFRALAELWRGEGEALGYVALPSGTGGSVDGYEVHPALLDAAFHVVAAAGALGPGEAGPFVPVAVDRVELRARPGGQFWAYASVTGSDVTGWRATVELLDDAGEVLLRCEGLSLKRLEAPLGPGGDWLYVERWEEAPRPARGLHTVSAATLAAGAQPLLDAHATRLGLGDYYEAVEPALDAMTRRYAADALSELGFDPVRHVGLPADVLAGALGVAEPHHRFFARLLGLSLAGSDDEAPQPLAPADLAASHPPYRSAVELVRWSGERLAATLRGEADARDWMVAGESSSLLRELYAVNPGFAVYTETLADVVATVAAASPGRPLRVLEVGAGTGAATARILDRLGAGPVEYLFTDVSAFFLKPTRERFGHRSGFRTGLLDVEEPPLETGTFDVVVAADVVHATADVRRTLRNLHARLAPGGTLVLMEAVCPSPWLDLVFGQFEGWWRFADPDLRADHPLVAVPEWLGLLDAAGFASVAAVADGDRRQDGPDSLQAVLIATTPAVPEAPRPRRRWLVLTDRRGVGPEVAATLRERGDDCVLVWPGPGYRRFGADAVELAASSPADWARLLDDVGEPHALLHLWALDAAGPPSGCDELLSLQERSCGSLVALTQAMAGSGRSLPELWLVTAGVQPVDGDDGDPVNVGQAPLWGLGRVVRTERGSARCHLVDLGPDCSPDDVVALVEELEAADTAAAEEVVLRAGARYVRRLGRAILPADAAEPGSARSPDDASFRLAVRRPGDLESLVAQEMPGTAPGPGEVAVRVVAGALNFRDVLVALGVGFAASGKDLTEVALGWECAGVVTAVGEGVTGLLPGDEVIAVAAGSLGSCVVTRVELVVHKPARLSFEEAATLPVAFLTAEYALRRLGRLARGERVLIHAAAGGVGLAAVHLARRAGAQVFATAGTPEKRAYLESLGIEHVMDSRSLAFADEVLGRTGGEGVDVILNSLAGEAVARGLAILRPHGRFIEIGKRDIYEDGSLDLRPFRRNLSYLALDLHSVYDEQPALVGTMLRSLVADVERGELRPLPHHDFDLAEAPDAFRFMAQARHTGKVVLTVRQPAYDVVGRRRKRRFDSEGTYLVTGGLGGFGLAVAHWLVAEGVRHLVLMSRSGAPHPDDAASLEDLLASEASVVVLRGDVAQRDDVSRVLGHVRAAMPPLRGVVHAAMVLDDGLLGRLDYPRFEAVLAPKLAGAWNLHELTAADDLDLFVLFSSISSVIGQPAQANYAAGNAFLDALAAHRRAGGQPALAINWGTIEGAGYVARHPEIERRMRRQGLAGMAPEAACEVLGQLLTHGVTRMVVSAGEWGAGRREPAPGADSDSSDDGLDGTPAPAVRDRPRLAGAPPGERGALVDRYLREATARVLELAPERIDPDRPLFQLGLDSLMAVELRTAVRAELGVEIPIVDLLEDLSIRGLAAAVLARLEDGDARVE